jgi:hypothetical protein
LAAWSKLERVACSAFLFLSLPARGRIARGGGDTGVGSKGAGSSVAKLNSSLSIGLLVISINRQSTVRLCTFLLVEVLPYNGILG